MMSMVHSLEVRPPLLLPDLIDFAFRIPFSMKLRGRTLKYCLRKAYEGVLPDSITGMPKIGLNAPLGKMINGPLREFVKELLSPASLAKLGVFRESFVEKLLEEQFARSRDHSYKIWALACFAKWHEIYCCPDRSG